MSFQRLQLTANKRQGGRQEEEQTEDMASGNFSSNLSSKVGVGVCTTYRV